MLKLLFIIPALSLFLSGENSQQEIITSIDKVENTPKTIADLNEVEKAEFIKHIIETGDCEWKGIKLYGKVQFVESFPDIKVEFVTSFPDIKVEFVSSFPDKCGKWQEVTSFPDFKVQVVTSFPDLKVQKVTSFPGMN